MKKQIKLLALILAVVFVTIFAFGCGNTGGTSVGGESESKREEESAANSEEESVNNSIDKGDKNNPSYGFDGDGELQASAAGKQSTVNKLQTTDDYGRSVDYIDGYKTDKSRYVGLFYFTWLGWHGNQMDGIYDVSKLIDEDPSSLWSTENNSASPLGKYHFWGEPLYGYYNSKDPWVIRKQIELFTLAGIDFIAFDCTNGFDYIDVVSEILPIMQEYYDAGWNVPKFMFYLNSNSGDVIERLYSGRPTASDNKLEKYGIYKNGYYKDLWFMPNGNKPKIVAITEPTSTCGEGAGNNRVTNEEILNFFDFWESVWPNNTQWENGLAWMDWNKPEQKVLGGKDGTINVSVAQHNLLPFSDALLNEELADRMYGRGYTAKNGADHSDDAIDSALNFEEEWAVAIDKDVKYTFVTGWNEWVAIKSAAALGQNKQYLNGKKRVYFVDTVNREYSRDIEMMKGGYGDNVYLSLMRNARTYKGKTGTLPASGKAAIDISKGLTQWNAITDVYYDMAGEINRNYTNFSRSGNYVDNSLLNDIEEIRVTHDDDYLYFLVKCADDIKINVEKDNWMNLLIDVEGQQNNKSFYGYDYIVNRKSSYSGNCSVEKLTYKNQKLSYDASGVAKFSVSGRYMQYKVSKKALGITGSFRINFKIADNVTDPADISSYYITGEAAPVGRLNYIFKG